MPCPNCPRCNCAVCELKDGGWSCSYCGYGSELAALKAQMQMAAKDFEDSQEENDRLKGLVREMGRTLQSSQVWLVTLKAHHSGNWSKETHSMWDNDYDKSNTILNRPEVRMLHMRLAWKEMLLRY